VRRIAAARVPAGERVYAARDERDDDRDRHREAAGKTGRSDEERADAPRGSSDLARAPGQDPMEVERDAEEQGCVPRATAQGLAEPGYEG
jgi:hypothetical protein